MVSLKHITVLLMWLCIPHVVGAQDSSATIDRDRLNVLWTVHRIDGRDLLEFPARGLNAYLPLVPGVTEVDDELHIRGARSDAAFYQLEGFGITNPVRNTPIVSLIPEAVEYVDVHTGAYGAGLGRANGGVIVSRMREGGDTHEFSARYSTDELARPGTQLFGTTVQGYRNATLTASGPVWEGIRFFVAGQHTFLRNRQPLFLEPFRFDGLRVDINDARYDPSLPAEQQALLPGPVEMRKDYLGSNWRETNTVQGNLSASYGPLNIRMTGSYESESEKQGSWPLVRRNFYRQERLPVDESTTSFFGLSLSHAVYPWLSYSVGYAATSFRYSSMDPHFGDDWQIYSDSAANAQIGFTDFRRTFAGPYRYSTSNTLSFYHPHDANRSYEKGQMTSQQVTLSSRIHLADSWDLGLGGNLEWWTLRRFYVGNISGMKEILYGIDGQSPIRWSDQELTLGMVRFGSMRVYGFDPYGNVSDDVAFLPYKPEFGSLYAEMSFHGEEYLLTAGVRYESLNPMLRYFPDEDIVPRGSGYFVNDTVALTTHAYGQWLPRLAISVQPTRSVRLSVSLGRYVQFPALSRMLMSAQDRSRYDCDGCWAPFEILPGGQVQPERSSHVELGATWDEPDGISRIDISAYQKVMPNLLAYGKFDDARRYSRTVWRNTGETVVKGIDITWSLHPSSRVQVQLLYSLTDALSTQTHPGSNILDVALFQDREPGPVVYSPLGYQRRHQGAVLSSLRFRESDGPVLKGLTISPVLSLLGGVPYTTESEDTPLGQVGPYTAGVRTLLDPRLALPLEPDNSSVTPWIVNIDLHVAKQFRVGAVTATLFVDILNVANRKHILNVYPTTGQASEDGWLNSQLGRRNDDPIYRELYTALNLDNREHYMQATGNDIYGVPRQIRFGVTVEM